jgi:hypothetical protein
LKGHCYRGVFLSFDYKESSDIITYKQFVSSVHIAVVLIDVRVQKRYFTLSITNTYSYVNSVHCIVDYCTVNPLEPRNLLDFVCVLKITI